MKYLPYIMELCRLTGIILIAAVLLMVVMVTAPAAQTDEQEEPVTFIGVVTGAGAKLAAQYAPLAPAGHWYDGIQHWWDNWSPGFPPDLFWWLESPEPEPVKVDERRIISAQGGE